jgi:hypothetical protein
MLSLMSACAPASSKPVPVEVTAACPTQFTYSPLAQATVADELKECSEKLGGCPATRAMLRDYSTVRQQNLVCRREGGEVKPSSPTPSD